MTNRVQKKLADLFGDYRAEWTQDLYGSLFVVPTYFERLSSQRPCFLIGGRGTGKTVALRSLRFDSTSTRLHSSEPTKLPHIGFYVRINKNRVRAFRGTDLPQETWSKAFAHYFNLLVSLEFCRACDRVAELEKWPTLPKAALFQLSDSLGIARVEDLRSLEALIQESIARLELFVNNVDPAQKPTFSIAEAPVRAIVEILERSGQLGGRSVICCVDEYENLLDDQQGVLNTYVKHSEPPLTYKIGVRRYGIRNRHTIDGSDLLVTPDDFMQIDIDEEDFDKFAIEVLSRRLEAARESGVPAPQTADELLPSLSRREEASALGADRAAAVVYDEAVNCPPNIKEWLQKLPPEDAYLITYWSEGSGEPIKDLITDWHANPSTWQDRLNNYGVASLFWLSKGRKGARIRKYYCGTQTFIHLACGNIRYFLELIDQSLDTEFAKDSSGEKPDPQRRAISVSARSQTEAAKLVGKRRLDQLEGLSERGVELKRLVLALGKVFFELARTPGHSPEATSFVLNGSQEAIAETTRLLQEGVSHLALVVSPRTKATSDLEVKDEEYRLHPIFCPFFEFSYRKKRRITLSANTLLQLGSNPRGVIGKLLENRSQTADDELPEQLSLFSAFYEGGQETA